MQDIQKKNSNTGIIGTLFKIIITYRVQSQSLRKSHFLRACPYVYIIYDLFEFVNCKNNGYNLSGNKFFVLTFI